MYIHGNSEREKSRMSQVKSIMINTDLYELAKIHYEMTNSPLSFKNYLLVLISKGHKNNKADHDYDFQGKNSQLLDISTDSDWLLDCTNEQVNDYLSRELSNYTNKNYTTSILLKQAIYLLNMLSSKSTIAGRMLSKIYQNRSKNILSIRYILYEQAVNRHKLNEFIFSVIGLLLFLVGQSYLQYASKIASGLSDTTSFSNFSHYVVGHAEFLLVTFAYFALVLTVLGKFNKNKTMKKVEQIGKILAILTVLATVVGYTIMDFEMTIRMTAIVMTAITLSVLFIGFGFVVNVFYKIIRLYLDKNLRNMSHKSIPYKTVEGKDVTFYSIQPEKEETIYLKNAFFTKNKNYGGMVDEMLLEFEKVSVSRKLSVNKVTTPRS